MYGGSNATGASTELYQYDFSSGKVTNLKVAGTHPSNGVACLIIGNTFYLFGGECSQRVSSLDLSVVPLAWTEVQINSENNPSTMGATVVAHTDGTSVYLWGGSCANHSDASTLWKFDLRRDAWIPETPQGGASPPPRAFQAMGSDLIAPQQTIVIYGGESTTEDKVYGDVWLYDTSTQLWAQQNPDSTTGPPPARTKANSLYTHGRMIFFSGSSAKYDNTPINDMWEVVVQKSCFDWSVCDDCTAKDGCGWCPNNPVGFQCVSGNSIGPYISGDCKQTFIYTATACTKPFPTYAIVLCAITGVIVLAFVVWILVKRVGARHSYSAITMSTRESTVN